MSAEDAVAGRWFLVQTQAGRELLAETHLTRQAYQTFLPSTWRSIRHARKIRTERTAFFPGYLFVRLDLDRDRWRPIDGTTGVIQVVKASGRPLAAPQGLVDALADAIDTDGALRRTGAAGVKAGDLVRLIRGPFADQLARVEHASGPERVRILLAMMGQAVPVEVSRHDLALT